MRGWAADLVEIRANVGADARSGQLERDLKQPMSLRVKSAQRRDGGSVKLLQRSGPLRRRFGDVRRGEMENEVASASGSWLVVE